MLSLSGTLSDGLLDNSRGYNHPVVSEPQFMCSFIFYWRLLDMFLTCFIEALDGR